MVELSKDRYEGLLEPIMQVPFNMLMARSVLVHHVDGRVFVDSFEKPRSVYIVHPYGMTYLYGDSGDEAFNQSLLAYFAGKLYDRKKDEWLQAFPRDWDGVMNRLVDEGIASPYSRLNFKFDAVAFYKGYHQADKSQYEIVATPTDLLFALEGSVVPKDYWNTPEQCDAMAKTFTLMIDGKPAATAFTSARHGDQLEIGIETVPEHRGKGLAYLVSAKLIASCLEQNIEPVWACRLENTGSVNLAKKLGFAETRRMPYYHVPQ